MIIMITMRDMVTRQCGRKTMASAETIFVTESHKKMR